MSSPSIPRFLTAFLLPITSLSLSPLWAAGPFGHGFLTEEISPATSHFAHVQQFQIRHEHAEHYATTVLSCEDPKCKFGCSSVAHVQRWFDGGPFLRGLPPAYRDPQRPGHYMSPEDALEQFAKDKYQTPPNEEKPPSVLASEMYEQLTKGAPLAGISESDVVSAVQSICGSKHLR